MDLTAKINQVLLQYIQIDQSTKLCIALSGGQDSLVLLHALKKLYPNQICAIHINHQLQPINEIMEQQCKEFCKMNHIPLDTIRVNVPAGNEEAQAREMRYQAFLKAKAPIILLAHHMNDFSETLLIRLYQGRYNALPYSMPTSRLWGNKFILRPMIHVKKKEIISYAAKYSLKWIDDPSNLNISLLRNKIRHQLMHQPLVISLIKQLTQYTTLVKKFDTLTRKIILKNVSSDHAFLLQSHHPAFPIY